MKLIALGKEAGHVCLRYRIDPVRTALKAQGHWFSLQRMPRTPWGRLALYHDLRKVDAVIVQRRLLSTWELPFFRRASKRLVFDFDDAFFQKNSFHSKSDAPRRLARFKAMVQAADLVFAGNEYLAECAGQYTSAEKIVFMPTCIDVECYPQARHTRSGQGVRLVWIGSSSTLRTLEQQGDLWNQLGRAYPGLELHIVCDRFPHWPGIKVVPISWSEATEKNVLASCDIGLAWLPNDTWSQGKCGLKVLQYQAAGLPVITSPVGANRQMVRPMENGLWATTVGEWIEAVGKLINDPRLRQQLGQNGRKAVKANYSVSQLIHRWKVALQIPASGLMTSLERDSLHRTAA